MKTHFRAFTLIELMLVVAIIGILCAIAIPAFNEYRTKAREASAKSDAKTLIQAVIAAKN